MKIPFTKAHGAKNDFLLTWKDEVPPDADLPELARAICERNTGVGADGWLLVDPRPGIRLFNSDGSEPELSGNGTRCAASFLHRHGHTSESLDIATGAGNKHLRMISRDRDAFWWEMNMGRPRVEILHHTIHLAGGDRDVTLVNCGNPQCAVPVDDFEFDWVETGRAIESHPDFPDRTNVSFLRRIDEHTIAARFYERGAGVTMSSGTGATGAAFCAMARGFVSSPVKVETPAGPLDTVERGGDVWLTGPAVIVADGVFFAP